MAAPDIGAAPSADALVAPPRVRVAVRLQVERASLAADSGVAVWPGGAGRSWRVPRATFLSAPRAAATGFDVQVATLGDEPAARAAAGRAGKQAGRAGRWEWAEQAGAYRVRVGPYPTREEARRAAQRLSGAGFPGAWVTPARPAAQARFLEAQTGVESALVVPQRAGEPLAVDGERYRGVVEVRADARGGLTVVNAVGLEDYLRGVVPQELSPEAFPELEALKAQAVAARTYAVRHHGESAAWGYDLCATAACQVYGGLGAERELSDRAVAETRGLVATWQGRPIEALYTSTCGGHTEDGWSIFTTTTAERAPYLKGVACAPELGSWGRLVSAAAPAGAARLARDLALLEALEVIPADWRAAPERPLSGEELAGALVRLRRALGRSGAGCPELPAEAPVRRGAAFTRLLGALCWEERLRLLAPNDALHALPPGEEPAWSDAREKLAAALLLQEGVLAPFADGALRPGDPLRRGEAVALMARGALAAGPPALRHGRFRRNDGGRLVVALGEGREESLPVDPGVRLFRSHGRDAWAAAELQLAPGDELRYLVSAGRVVFAEAPRTGEGQAWDRGSRYYRWEVRATPRELAERAAGEGWRGPLEDVVVRRRGVSGRVIEAALIGPEGELTLRGLEVRRALGLRENLFTIERERGTGGAVATFVFSGKGWGHGVGLCQVGAFGMARAGARFDEILRHYYPGVEVEPAR